MRDSAKFLAKLARYRQRNRDRLREDNRRYSATPRGKLMIARRRTLRRMREANTPAKLASAERYLILVNKQLERTVTPCRKRPPMIL